MANQRIPLTQQEIKEIAALPALQKLWGMKNTRELEAILNDNFTWAFKHAGLGIDELDELFVIQPEMFDSTAPTRILRGDYGKLVVIN